ncbi:MAG: hypothetical protein Q8N77_03480 [Nanoarchaeota archaeon]|nr:hypothetical protein [Nanoarchaeota archaeon]
MAKKYLEDKLTGIAGKYDKDVVIKHAELRNIYYGRDKSGARDKGIHTVKKRYAAAEKYLQDKVRSKKLSAEERKYVMELATAFTGYDTSLDRRRKSESYKKKVSNTRASHMSYTLDSLADETPQAAPVTSATQANALSAYGSKVSGWFKRHYKCAIATAGALALGVLIGYHVNNYDPKPQPPMTPPKQVQVIKQKEPDKVKKPVTKKPLVKQPEAKKPETKPQDPITQEEKRPEEAKEIKKPSLEEQLDEISLKYGSLPISSVEKHTIDHKVQKVLGLKLETYTVRDEKLKDCSYSPKDLYPILVRALESKDVAYMHMRMSSKGLVPAMQVELSSNPEENISETDVKKHSSNYGFLTNMGIVNFDGKASDNASCKGYEVKVKLEGNAKEKALEALRLIHWHLSYTNDSKSFHSYWDLRDKHTPVIKGHVIYSDKDVDDEFKLSGIVFAKGDTEVEVVSNGDDIKIGQGERQSTP